MHSLFFYLLLLLGSNVNSLQEEENKEDLDYLGQEMPLQDLDDYALESYSDSQEFEIIEASSEMSSMEIEDVQVSGNYESFSIEDYPCFPVHQNLDTILSNNFPILNHTLDHDESEKDSKTENKHDGLLFINDNIKTSNTALYKDTIYEETSSQNLNNNKCQLKEDTSILQLDNTSSDIMNNFKKKNFRRWAIYDDACIVPFNTPEPSSDNNNDNNLHLLISETSASTPRISQYRSISLSSDKENIENPELFYLKMLKADNNSILQENYLGSLGSENNSESMEKKKITNHDSLQKEQKSNFTNFNKITSQIEMNETSKMNTSVQSGSTNTKHNSENLSKIKQDSKALGYSKGYLKKPEFYGKEYLTKLASFILSQSNSKSLFYGFLKKELSKVDNFSRKMLAKLCKTCSRDMSHSESFSSDHFHNQYDIIEDCALETKLYIFNIHQFYLNVIEGNKIASNRMFERWIETLQKRASYILDLSRDDMLERLERKQLIDWDTYLLQHNSSTFLSSDEDSKEYKDPVSDDQGQRSLKDHSKDNGEVDNPSKKFINYESIKQSNYDKVFSEYQAFKEFTDEICNESMNIDLQVQSYASEIEEIVNATLKSNNQNQINNHSNCNDIEFTNHLIMSSIQGISIVKRCLDLINKSLKFFYSKELNDFSVKWGKRDKSYDLEKPEHKTKKFTESSLTFSNETHLDYAELLQKSPGQDEVTYKKNVHTQTDSNPLLESCLCFDKNYSYKSGNNFGIKVNEPDNFDKLDREQKVNHLLFMKMILDLFNCINLPMSSDEENVNSPVSDSNDQDEKNIKQDFYAEYLKECTFDKHDSDL